MAHGSLYSTAFPRPPRKPLSLSIVLPCYNEEENVERVAGDALRMARQLADDYEVVIVNDGSRDRTGELAEAMSRRDSHLRVVHNNPNKGYGGALAAGFRAASKQWVFYTDGDGQFDLGELPKLLPLLEQYDIVTCYRAKRRDPIHRKINAFMWTSLVGLLFRLRIRDVDCAFKIYPKHLFERITMHSNSALIDTEVLAKARNLGYTMTQIPVTHLPRAAGTQTGAKLSSIFKAFRELFALYRNINAEGREHGGGRAN
ncbi:MAG: glycosyltransferase family 2 protein [Phycisphaerales bacterium]|nr:glycosyltransferase family 2 protein [Phycisphaerales bacterium]